MRDDQIPDAELSPWHPITEPVLLKHLGKLAEEVNELGAIVARIIIQGVDECNPDTGELNRHALESEMADVLANCQLVGEHLGLNIDRVTERAKKKLAKLQAWHRMA